jgi:two-component system sensor histidine kinase KdpD
VAVGVSLGPFIVLALAIVPFRASLSISTTALILMVPVVGVSTDGFYIGAFDVAVGFLIYDYVFIPPYYTLSVGASQNWVALVIYATVMLVVSKVVSDLKEAKGRADQASKDTRRLMEFSQDLVGQRSPEIVTAATAKALFEVFALDSVSLYLSDMTHNLKEMIALGRPIQSDVIASLTPQERKHSYKSVSQMRRR